MRTHVLTSLLLTASLATAQKTWIVDAANGAGTHYTDLPAAVAAAGEGDTLIVRPGTYKGIVVTKGIAILGQSGAIVQPVSFIGAAVTIKDLKAGSIFRMRGILVQDVFPIAQKLLIVANNTGSVHLEDVTVKTRNVHPRSPYMEVINCRAVTLNRCDSPTGCQIATSKVMVNGGSYHGTNGYAQWGHGCWNIASSPAFIVTGSEVQFSQTRVDGGNGANGCWNQNPIAGSPAIRATASKIVVAGAGTVINSGISYGHAMVGTAASTLVLDPASKSNRDPSHTGFQKVSSKRMPVIDVRGGAVGGSIAVDYTSQQGHFFILLESLPFTPLPVADFGSVWLDYRYLIPLGLGVLDATEKKSFVLPVPNDAGFRGVPILLQGWGGTFGYFRYTNAWVTTLE